MLCYVYLLYNTGIPEIFGHMAYIWIHMGCNTALTHMLVLNLLFLWHG